MVSISFENEVALITGGCSGIGGGIARMFAQAGASLALTGRRPEKEISGFLDEMEKTYGKRPLYIQCDIADEPGVRESVRKTAETFGRLDIVVNNAGGHGDWIHSAKMHMVGCSALIEEAAPYLAKAPNGGRIVIISSCIFLYGGHSGQKPEYIATKAGEAALTVYYARQLAPDNIRVNCIMPGPIMTELLVNVFGSEEAIRERYEPTLPLHKMGEIKDIAGVALFLCSDLSAYLNGQQLCVDGGRFPCGA